MGFPNRCGKINVMNFLKLTRAKLIGIVVIYISYWIFNIVAYELKQVYLRSKDETTIPTSFQADNLYQLILKANDEIVVFVIIYLAVCLIIYFENKRKNRV